jgi:hypothetical protein
MPHPAQVQSGAEWFTGRDCASSQMVAPRIADIDSKCMIIRIEHAKGPNDRYCDAIAAFA